MAVLKADDICTSEDLLADVYLLSGEMFIGVDLVTPSGDFALSFHREGKVHYVPQENLAYFRLYPADAK